MTKFMFVLFSVAIGADVVLLSDVLVKNYVEGEIADNEESWPPDLPTVYTELSLMYHQGQYNSKKESSLMIKLIEGGLNYESLQYVLNADKSTKVTKNVTDIFANLDTRKYKKEFILIEGASGMGKSTLLKEIACRWANKQLLTTFRLVFLVCLQDPALFTITSLNDFLEYYCEKNCMPKSITESIAGYSDHISENGGNGVAFLLDAFDRYPAELCKSSFIYKLVKRKALPNCTLVAASCPHASACLRRKATVRVYILGFTEKEQKQQFVEEALKDQPQNIREVTQFLEHDSTLNTLCSIPFSMAALLFLYNLEEILFSTNRTALYNRLVCIIICRHLAKYGHSFENKTYDLSNLPTPYNSIIIELCKLSLESLRSKTNMIFSLTDLKNTCPAIAANLETINGYGLLQAVQLECATGRTTIFSFTHDCIRDVLAALHVHSLDKLLQCLYFFRFCFETGRKEICRHIANAKTFNSRSIILRGTSLSYSDVECITLFLTQSPCHKWEELDLHGCYIQDQGINILHDGFITNSITIKRLSLSKNKLTESSSSKVYEIAIHCRVEVLAIRFNPSIGTDPKLYSILSDPNSVVKELYISHTNCRLSNTVSILFSELARTKELKVLHTSHNYINDDACSALITALQYNTCLTELIMVGNPLNITSALQIIQALEHNNSLQYLVLPWYPSKDQKKIVLLAKEIDKKRKCRLKLFCPKTF